MPIDAPPAPARDARRRPASGTIFVLACLSLCTAFVIFLVVGSPVLLERTLANAPPPAPQTVATGTLDGRAWSAEAVDGTAGLRVVGPDDIEPIVDAEPCMRVTLDGDVTALCVERRGSSIRGVSGVTGPDGTGLVFGVVAPQVTEVEVATDAGTPLRMVPDYVDFGFPLGFFTAEVEVGAVRGVTARDADGIVRATATCDASALASCDIVEADY